MSATRAGPAPSRTYRRIYAVVRRIPRGRVTTYGQVAALAGLPGHARQVALEGGLVDVKVCAVDEVWSGLKLVRRLKDRTR